MSEFEKDLSANETASSTQDGSELLVEGMTCQNCARHVTQALQAVSGVASAAVDLDAGKALVRWKPGAAPDAAALEAAVKKEGFAARRAPAAGGATKGPDKSKWSPFSGWRFNVVLGSMVTAPLMAAEWIFGLGLEKGYQYAAFAAVLPVQLFCGARFYRGAWNQLKIGGSNMDTLVVLGSTTAFLYSAWALFSGWPGHVFFMEAAAIITLISAGHWIEAKVAAKAAGSLRALLNLAPPTARLVRQDGTEVETAAAELQVGDRILLKPGDAAPTDGEVLEGASTADESMLTGESVPVEKSPGAKVFAGTVNLHGWLLVRVSATGAATGLAQIIQVVQRAQTSRANIQKLGDKVSSVFVPIVVLIALGTGLWWGLAPESALASASWMEGFLWTAHHPEGRLAAAIYHAAAVLIIACPCAMGLATPVAIMAGTNAASERGILVRDGQALEKTGNLTAVMFDKTGTVTQGKLQRAGAESFLDEAGAALGLDKLAASIAKPSLHPLSEAIGKLSAEVFPSLEWREVRGAGVEGRLKLPGGYGEGAMFRLGSLGWLRDQGIDVDRASEFAKQWTEQGATVLGFAGDRDLLGVFALRDELKPDAAKVLAELGRQGKTTYLVTGDNRLTGAAIGARLGIPPERVFAEVKPEDKAKLVARLQAQGERIAFVGDGINDAPALETADLGIAVARASDVAREAADIILLKSDINAVPEALELAKSTLRTIKQNLFWAFFYNAAGIPLAVFGFMSPVFSALAMGLSDLMVIGNALRLRRRGRRGVK